MGFAPVVWGVWGGLGGLLLPPSRRLTSGGVAPWRQLGGRRRFQSAAFSLLPLLLWEVRADGGPSGVGVNELRRRLIGINPHLFQSAVPHTTRPQKSYEVNGREYHYVPKETFENMVYSHRMLEYGEYKGNLYGTSIDAVRAVLDAGKICIVDLEPQSIQLARTHELKPYIIFIKPSSMSCMKQSRKNARMITDYYVNMKFKEEDLQEMEESAKKMEMQFGQFFDHIIVNDHLQEACGQLLAAVRRAQDEPQWVPATWICSENQP